MSKCREAYEKQYGEDFNPDNSPVASVWQAAWNAATKNVVKICEGQMTGVNPVGDMAREECAAPVVQEKQEPWPFSADRVTYHKAAPVVQPDMVMVPREPTEAMLDAAMNRYKHVGPEAKARYTQMHRENFRCDYKAMIAAAEGKSNAVAHREAACGRSGGAEC